MSSITNSFQLSADSVRSLSEGCTFYSSDHTKTTISHTSNLSPISRQTDKNRQEIRQIARNTYAERRRMRKNLAEFRWLVQSLYVERRCHRMLPIEKTAIYCTVMTTSGCFSSTSLTVVSESWLSLVMRDHDSGSVWIASTGNADLLPTTPPGSRTPIKTLTDVRA